MLLALGVLTYLTVGYSLGRISSNEYFNQTPTKKLSFFGKLRRILLFPFSYTGKWENRNPGLYSSDPPFSPRSWVDGGDWYHRDGIKESHYCRFTAIVWPFKLLLAIIGILCGFFMLVWGILVFLFNLPDIIGNIWGKLGFKGHSSMHLRTLLKCLLIATWGQSIVLSPFLLILAGWPWATLNIALAWLGWKFGAKLLVNNKNSLTGDSGVLEELSRFREEELDKPLSDIAASLELLASEIGEIKIEYNTTSATVDALKNTKHILAESFMLNLKRLSNLLAQKEAEKVEFEKIQNDLTSGKSDMSLYEKLLATTRFIESKRPGGTNGTKDNLAKEVRARIDACREMIDRASQMQVRSLSVEMPDSAVPETDIEDIASEIVRGEDMAERITARSGKALLRETESETVPSSARQRVSA